jgi:hypothetical protein
MKIRLGAEAGGMGAGLLRDPLLLAEVGGDVAVTPCT